MPFPALSSPIHLGGCRIRNRIVLTGHDTNLAADNRPTDALTAYYQARARGGAGLVVVQVIGVHPTACESGHMLMATSDDCIPAFSTLFDAIRAEGATAVAQLFHPGRERHARLDGIVAPCFSPSVSPSERHRTVPVSLEVEAIEAIVEGYGDAARRLAQAGADGVEIVASHGYLLAQFLNPNVNRRNDAYGGNIANRLRLTREILAACRRQLPPDRIIGLRLSVDDRDLGGCDAASAREVCCSLAPDIDYLSLVAGTASTQAGAIHIVPPMSHGAGYLAQDAAAIRGATGKPVILTGRINQPQEAERLIASGAADLCGMTRAMICDADMPAKALGDRSDEIRACIGCNQACIGHYEKGLPISCIQNPESGRELALRGLRPTGTPRKVVVVGGGVAGMKSAVTAARFGHRVTLFEASARLGGQALLAHTLPGRAEFGGIVTNLEQELARTDVLVRKGVRATPELVAAEAPDALIVATGSLPALPELDDGGNRLVQAVDVLSGHARTGPRVVVYDWRADWVGAGVAEKLARDGVHVRLAVNGPCAAASLQTYVRDEAVATLFRLGVETLPFMRLFGVDEGTAYFLHTIAQEPIVLEAVDSVVVNFPNRPVPFSLPESMLGGLAVHVVGDALSPRTAEEAVYEGFMASLADLTR
ncbi:MAG: NAD(P)-binding protein [Rhizobiales bacterium]|nr:NAD(P)-binding protein [Hyphomicrobiales bacterium]